MYETTMKMGKKTDGGQWVFGKIQDRKETESAEHSIMIDDHNQIHTVETDSISGCLTLRDSQVQDLYEGHIISCLIDGEVVNQLVASGFEFTGEGVVTIWMPFDQCSMQRGPDDELIDVKIIGHAFENPELLELID
ncbi:hypothetical protein ACTHQ2_23190 [Bacillus subtilis]|uniref:hypothetical protein n=1 Tax=Bacillus subtilis TaxID=1423 RepID=UPI003F7C6CAD